jgi:hypothetical protein
MRGIDKREYEFMQGWMARTQRYYPYMTSYALWEGPRNGDPLIVFHPHPPLRIQTYMDQIFEKNP